MLQPSGATFSLMLQPILPMGGLSLPAPFRSTPPPALQSAGLRPAAPGLSRPASAPEMAGPGLGHRLLLSWGGAALYRGRQPSPGVAGARAPLRRRAGAPLRRRAGTEERPYRRVNFTP